MSNFRYPYGNEKILSGEIAWPTTPIVALLVGTEAYTPSTIHQHLADIPEDAIVATSGTMTNRTCLLGVADADDVTWGTVPAGPQANAVVLATQTGDRSTSVLIAFMSDVVGLPVDPDGSDITVHWDQGQNKIFVL